jgi:metallophosphoesterase (TIGR00282 family)
MPRARHSRSVRGSKSAAVIPSNVPGKTEEHLRLIVLGDVVGWPGRDAVCTVVPRLREQLAPDLVIVNGENAAGGAGIDAGTALEIKSAGVDVITLGDHAFQRKGVAEFLDKNGAWCIRPANYAEGAPGTGFCVVEVRSGVKVLVTNLLGRIFINGTHTCPFRSIDALLAAQGASEAQIVVVDMHAEATSEKWSMARYLDGRASLLVGTHTHVQTADAQILPQGLGYVSDLGMCGSNAGVIGMKTEVALKRFLKPTPAPYEIAEGDALVTGIVADVSTTTRRARWIAPLRVDPGSGKASQGSNPR